MPIWGYVLVIPLIIVIVAYVSGRLLPTTFTGKTYFKKLLWGNGIDWRPLPDVCIQDFVADAFDYAKSVSSAPANPAVPQLFPKVHFYVEFQRMLRIHAFVAAALLSGKKRAEIYGLETQRIEAAIRTALSSGQNGAGIWKLGAKKARESITQEAVIAALLRKRVALTDFEALNAVDADVKSGKEWEVQEGILKKHGVLH